MSNETSGKAIASFIFGILGLIGDLPCIGSILAIILGSGDPDGLAQAGRIMGWIGVVLALVTALVLLGFVLLGGTIAIFENM